MMNGNGKIHKSLGIKNWIEIYKPLTRISGWRHFLLLKITEQLFRKNQYKKLTKIISVFYRKSLTKHSAFPKPTYHLKLKPGKQPSTVSYGVWILDRM